MDPYTSDFATVPQPDNVEEHTEVVEPEHVPDNIPEQMFAPKAPAAESSNFTQFIELLTTYKMPLFALLIAIVLYMYLGKIDSGMSKVITEPFSA